MVFTLAITCFCFYTFFSNNIVTLNGVYYFDTNLRLRDSEYMFKGKRISDGKFVVIIQSNKVHKTNCKCFENIGNQNVLTYIDSITTNSHTYLIVDLYVCNLGDLKLEFGGKFSLSDMQIISRQLSKGYMALYCAGATHGNLKPENILVERVKTHAARLLLDGYRQKVCSKIKMQTSEPYLAPETYKGRISSETDMWALGAILYECYTNRNFKEDWHVYGDSTVKTHMNCAPTEENAKFDLFVDMVERMVKPIPEMRLKPTDFFTHPFHSSVDHSALLIRKHPRPSDVFVRYEHLSLYTVIQ